MIRRRAKFWLPLLSLCLQTNVSAAVPKTGFLYPSGGLQGTKLTVSTGKSTSPWPPKVWTSHAGIQFSPQKKAGEWDVVITEATPPGPYLVRFFSQDGSTEPVIFAVSRAAEIVEESGENGSLAEAQAIPFFPVIVNGQLDKRGDTDFYAVPVNSGDTLVARLDGYALGAKMDPVLALYDSRGVQLALNHDTHNLDPRLTWTATFSGNVFVQVMAFVHPPSTSINFSGGNDHVYRLFITLGPHIRFGMPAAMPHGGTGSLRPIGTSLTQKELKLTMPKDLPEGQVHWETDPILGDAYPVVATAGPVMIETEPNDSREKANLLWQTNVVSGLIGRPGDIDRFAFHAERRQQFQFRVKAGALNSSLDPWLGVEDGEGKLLTSRNDTKDFDLELAWRAPADGQFFLALRDLYRGGGADFPYVLFAGESIPDFTALMDSHLLTATSGKTNELKVKVTRINGHADSLVVRAINLPTGVSATPVAVPPKGGEVKLQVVVAAEATPTNCPIRIVAEQVIDGSPVARSALFPVLNTDKRGDRLINQSPDLWLTVVAPKKAPPKPPAKK